MSQDVVIVDGLRTPFLRTGGAARNLSSAELGRQVLSALVRRMPASPSELEEVIMGCVVQPADAVNVSRVSAIQAGIPLSVPAYTVHRNCASSIESVASAWEKIQAGTCEVALAGGMESMSDAPILFPRSFSGFLTRLQKAKTITARLGVFLSLRWKDMKPRIGLMEGLTDPTCGLNMGQTAEILAREFGISRADQDAFAMESHRRAAKSRSAGRFKVEITPLYPAPDFSPQLEDDGIRPDSSMESLARLRPVFDSRHGTVTAGNSSQITDGAAVLLVTTKERAAGWGVKPLAKIRGYAMAGLEPKRMGLGPAVATAKALAKNGLSMKDIGLVEMNEAFAAQVLANFKIFDSKALAKERLGLEGSLSTLDPALVNPNGGAVALGHPVGASGARLILTLIHEMKARDIGMGLATLCVGGGQGAAMVLERTGYTQ